jgi:hypothetical protein
MVVEDMTLGLDMGVKRVSWVEHSLEPCYVDIGNLVGSNLLTLGADSCGVQKGTEMEA